MIQNKDDKNPVIPFDIQMHELYILAQDKFYEANESVNRYDLGFAAGVQHTLDWLRGEAPSPFEVPIEIEDGPSGDDLRPSAGELFHPADLGVK